MSFLSQVKPFRAHILGLLLISGLTSQAQSIFSDLMAVQYADSILVNWTLKGGFTCTNMELQRSSDNITFLEVYKVSGTCGASSDQYYSYIDSEMLENGKTYYYRIAASGEYFVSDTVSVLFVNAGDAPIFVYPNPSDRDLNITIDNTYKPPFLLEIYSADGKHLNKSEIVFGNEFVLMKGKLPDGLYIIKITTNDRFVFSTSVLLTR